MKLGDKRKKYQKKLRRRKRSNFSACAEKERLFSNILCCFSDVIGRFWNKKNSFWLAKCSILLKWNSFLQNLEVFKNRTSSVTRNKIGFVPRYWRREEKIWQELLYSTKRAFAPKNHIPKYFLQYDSRVDGCILRQCHRTKTDIVWLFRRPCISRYQSKLESSN